MQYEQLPIVLEGLTAIYLKNRGDYMKSISFKLSLMHWQLV